MTVWFFLGVALAFRAPRGLTLWVTWLLYGSIAVAVVSLLIAAAGLSSETSAFDIGVARVALYLTSGIAILMWIYRANWNARALGASGMEFTQVNRNQQAAAAAP